MTLVDDHGTLVGMIDCCDCGTLKFRRKKIEKKESI